MAKINAGLSVNVLDRLHEHTGLPIDAIVGAVGISSRTLARRRASGKLSSEESDRLVRFSRLVALALNLFAGDREAACGWLAARQRGLADASPLEMARTKVGARSRNLDRQA